MTLLEQLEQEFKAIRDHFEELEALVMEEKRLEYEQGYAQALQDALGKLKSC